MKTNTPALAILAAMLPFCAHAQAIPELPGLGAAKAQLAGDSAVVMGSASASEKACIDWPATAKVSRGVFESDYTVEVDGKKVGEIEEDGGSLILKGGNGKVQARAAISGSDSKQLAVVSGCGGAALGRIEGLYTDDQSAFNIQDASGKPLMTTGWVSGGDMAASAPSASMIVSKNGLFDNFTVTIHGAQTPVALFTAVMNNKAAYRRAAERRRDRMGDGPRGGRDNY